MKRLAGRPDIGGVLCLGMLGGVLGGIGCVEETPPADVLTDAAGWGGQGGRKVLDEDGSSTSDGSVDVVSIFDADSSSDVSPNVDGPDDVSAIGDVDSFDADSSDDADVASEIDSALPDPVVDAATGADLGGTDTETEADPPFIPSFPQIVYRKGKTLTNPILYAVTYDDYALRADIDDFMTTLGSSGDMYWTPVTQDYGIGAATATTIHIPGPAPAAIDDLQIQSFLASRLDGSHAEWGMPTANPLYVFFYPPSTTITHATLVGCSSYFGYHNWFSIPSGPWAGTRVAYVVIPQCSTDSSAIYSVTSTASHEILESVTDPFWDSTEGQGWWGVQPEFKIWEFLRGGEGEVGDLCEGVHLANYIPFGYKYRIQRIWSNSAALAGHNPCVPWNPQVFTYFNAIPHMFDTVTLKNFTQTYQTKGVRIPLGGQRTISVHLFSDGPTGDWEVTASDLSPLFGAGPRLEFAWNANSGNAGDVLLLTIKYLQGTARFGGAPFMLTSSNGSYHHQWFGYVSDF